MMKFTFVVEHEHAFLGEHLGADYVYFYRVLLGRVDMRYAFFSSTHWRWYSRGVFILSIQDETL